MHMAPSFKKWMEHGPHIHVMGFQNVRTHMHDMVHDSRFWAVLALALFCALVLTLAFLGTSSTTDVTPTLYPYGYGL